MIYVEIHEILDSNPLERVAFDEVTRIHALNMDWSNCLCNLNISHDLIIFDANTLRVCLLISFNTINYII